LSFSCICIAMYVSENVKFVEDFYYLEFKFQYISTFMEANELCLSLSKPHFFVLNWNSVVCFNKSPWIRNIDLIKICYSIQISKQFCVNKIMKTTFTSIQHLTADNVLLILCYLPNRRTFATIISAWFLTAKDEVIMKVPEKICWVRYLKHIWRIKKENFHIRRIIQTLLGRKAREYGFGVFYF